MQTNNITDQFIIDTFFSMKGNLTRAYQKLIDSNIDIKNYLDSRYSDCNDYNEILWRIKLGYETVPLCPVCKQNTIKFYGSAQVGYSQTCCKKCRDILWHNNQVSTVKKKYGVENSFQAEEVKEKIKETCLERYGYEFSLQVPEIREKGIETNLEKYGVKNGGGSQQAIEKIKQTCLERYGVENPSYVPEFIDKIRNTMHKKHTFATSKTETKIKELLISKFGINDIKDQYKSELYPFKCDFYIVSLDMYIECNFHWTHGFHKFDKNNIDDIEKLNKWKSKTTNYYKSAINVWTCSDLLKFKYAENNKLNYHAFYTYNECVDFINNL